MRHHNHGLPDAIFKDRTGFTIANTTGEAGKRAPALAGHLTI